MMRPEDLVDDVVPTEQTRSIVTGVLDHLASMVRQSPEGGDDDEFDDLDLLLEEPLEVFELEAGDDFLPGDPLDENYVEGEVVDTPAPTVQGRRLVAATTGSLAWGGHQNGHIPVEELTSIGGGHFLEAEAAAAFEQMRQEAAEEGVVLDITDSYRTFASQVDVKRRKPKLAATPGTSVHGWAKAIDAASAEARQWIQQNGARFGWVWPEWAQPGGSKPEDWHFEYRGGSTAEAQPQPGTEPRRRRWSGGFNRRLTRE